ncbi:MAG: hypothetical protein IJC55_04020 [Clostridia bacterium]|nr:hypothetical protein [Clostridia bacterium]
MQRNKTLDCNNRLKALAVRTVRDCTFRKQVQYFGTMHQTEVLLPSGDEKYPSFWVRDAAMMAESGLIADADLKRYIEIIATHGQNGAEALTLQNGLCVPPYTIADHINYDAKPVFFPGTYQSGSDQGSGRYGYFPPFCDNYYFITMVGYYIEQSADRAILNTQYNGLTLWQRMCLAFEGYNIDPHSQLCVSDAQKYTVDWGFTDTIKKSGKLLMASLLRYNAALTMHRLQQDQRYAEIARTIKKNVVETFYDKASGWFYSATEIGHQFDVWATAYAVYLGIATEQNTLQALYRAYVDGTAVVDGYVRQILTDHDHAADSAWESAVSAYNRYQNGGYWSTPTGWYAYALYRYNGKIDILEDFLRHTEQYDEVGSPFEWINAACDAYDGAHYGTSGVLPYIALQRILQEQQALFQ